MNALDFYNAWLDSRVASTDIGVDGGSFKAAKKRFGAGAAWDAVKRNLRTTTKLRFKSAFKLPIFADYPINAAEKRFGIDYVRYICEKRPVFADGLFAGDSQEEIKRILSTHFLAAHFDHVPWKEIFPGPHYEEFRKAERKHMALLTKKGDCYNYNGFKTRTVGFEYGVLANHCGLDVIPSERLESVKGSVVIDCGAFDGDSAFYFSSLSAYRILALEPDDHNFKALHENMELNSMESVVPLKCGVGDEKCTVSFSTGMACAKIADEGDMKIEIERIDDLVKEHGSGRPVGIIKMDIEGYETKALMGAAQTICADKPILIIALYHSGRDFFEIPAYLKSLRPDYSMHIASLNPLTPIFEKYVIAY